MPLEVHGEFTGDGLHVQWINDPDVKAALILDEAAEPALVQGPPEQCGYSLWKNRFAASCGGWN
ncbi:hypothetical protein [Maritalea sp.]|uniref:hypothetical protein n=1 Tax=Maritalea sp. TaxID=2003361 RepID=UPI003EF13FFA